VLTTSELDAQREDMRGVRVVAIPERVLSLTLSHRIFSE